jgi:hypothetical protein
MKGIHEIGDGGDSNKRMRKNETSGQRLGSEKIGKRRDDSGKCRAESRKDRASRACAVRGLSGHRLHPSRS